MKIAMLARNPNLYSHKRLVEAAQKRGHKIDIINTLQCYMNITSHRPELRYKGEMLVGYDAVIPRIGVSVTFYGLAVLRQFETMGVWPLNESVGIGRSRDKLRSLQLLAREGIGLPVTGFANSPKFAEDVIEIAGGQRSADLQASAPIVKYRTGGSSRWAPRRWWSKNAISSPS